MNPSSGNLHPTEAYVICGPGAGLGEAGVFHYDAEHHALERRCRLDAARWRELFPRDDLLLVGVTSIHWRESWKYGERAFRYCQHDLGHAVATLAVAASLAGWRTEMLPEWSHDQIAALLGLDRDEDYVDAEPEEPGCLLACAAGDLPDALTTDIPSIVAAFQAAGWTGRASQLSEEHVQWTFIDDVAGATRWAGRAAGAGQAGEAGKAGEAELRAPAALPVPPALPAAPALSALILQRRSAVDFDARTSISADAFVRMLQATLPGAGAPWDAIWWRPRVHLLLFVHRVDGLDPGLYFLPRDPAAWPRLRDDIGREFEPAPWEGWPELICVGLGDARGLSRRLSCDQDIAADGCFSLGMLTEFDASLAEHGAAFYRHLFWESGVVGQMLYLAAESEALSGTGIGCFYDDAVHDVLGLKGHAWQSLYHFTVGGAVEDRRLTVEPGYPWERSTP